MPFTKKLAIYAIGFLLGTGVLWLLRGNTISSTTKPYYRRPIQKQDLEGSRPVDPLLAFYYVEQAKPYGIKRILVYDRTGPSGFIRVEEKLSPDQPRQVLSRQAYIANRLELQLTPAADASSLDLLLERHRLILAKPISPHRYTVELPSPSFPMYKKTLHALKSDPLVKAVHRLPFP